MRRSRIPHKLPFSSCGKLNDRDYTTLVHHLERTNPFSTCPVSMTSPMKLLPPARISLTFLNTLNGFKDFFLSSFDVVWQVDVFYRLLVIFEVFTTASSKRSWKALILYNENFGWPCSARFLHWKVHEVVNVKPGPLTPKTKMRCQAATLGTDSSSCMNLLMSRHFYVPVSRFITNRLLQ